MSYIFYTAILLGVVVFVHELGHFLVAKLFDVKVIRFSIGMGPKLVGFFYGETEYIIGVLPLGGYVQMLGMSFEQTEDIDEDDRNRALMMKPIWQRTLVTLAGPVFNLIFPIFLFFVVIAFTHTKTDPSQIGQVIGAPAKKAGLKPGDKLIEIDGEKIAYWHDISSRIVDRPGETFPIVVERDGKSKTLEITPKLNTRTGILGNETKLGQIGVVPITYGSIISVDNATSIAAKAGFKDFDTIIGVNGKRVRRYDKVLSLIHESQGKELTFDLLRSNKLNANYGIIYSREPLQIKATPQCDTGVCTLGLLSAEMVLSGVQEESPAFKDGFRMGDRIQSIDGVEYDIWFMAISAIHTKLWKTTNEANDEGVDAEDINVSFDVVVNREGESLTLKLHPRVRNLDFSDYAIGWDHIANHVGPEEVDFPFGERIVHATVTSFTQTWKLIRLTTEGLARMLSGNMSMDNLSGPIGIGSMAANAGKEGWDKFLEMMAVISINIALVNLLPIPIMDGGNLLLYALEAIKRGPLSFRTRQIATYIGFSLIIVLFIFAFKNDIENNWAVFADWLNELF